MLDQPNLPGGHTGPWLFAHRGTSTLAPESTLAAFDLAQRAKADVFEIDIRLSQDGRLIVTHDASLVRTTNGKGLVADHTLDELKRLDAGYHFTGDDNETSWRGKGLQLLELSELFEAYPGVGINIDLKDANEQAVTRTAEVLETLNDGRWVNVGSFHPRIVRMFRAVAPGISTAASKHDVAALYFGRLLPGKLGERLVKRAAGDVLQIPQSWCGLPLNSRAFMQHAQAHKFDIMYWTINDADVMTSLLERGASGLVSDNVLEARAAIDQFVASTQRSR